MSFLIDENRAGYQDVENLLLNPDLVVVTNVDRVIGS